MISLPERLEDLSGLRAARWVRESTRGQVDRYGPDAQREQQDRALERYGLIDTDISWTFAHSGRTVAATDEFRSMLAAAGTDFDVLLVGYVSRFARNLRTAVNARHDLHAAGAAVLFCDEQVLSCDEEAWERWAREAVEAEAYSRRLGRRIREGYQAKRRRHGDPGGHAPFGFRRNGQKLMEPDPETAPIVERIVALAARGQPDRAIAAELDLGLFIVRGALTSPLPIGRLRDGTAAPWAPMVDRALWDEAQALRSRRATNAGRPASPARPYALSMLHCAACGARLGGDTGYYRHDNVCRAFAAARPPWLTARRGRQDGKAYRREAYEDAIGQLLGHVAVGAGALAAVVGSVTSAPTGPDRFALARIERERDAALGRYRRDRDTAVLDRTMTRLDAEEREAKRERGADGVPADVAVRYLRELDATWRAADGGRGRRQLAEALFDRIEALGFRELTVRLTEGAIAHGFGDVVPRRLDLFVGNGRGERI